MNISPSTRVLAVVAAGGAALISVLAAPAAMAATPADTSAPTAVSDTDSSTQLSPYGELVQNVKQQVLRQYPHAYLVEGDGVSPTGPTDDVANVTQWRFVFDDMVDGSHHGMIIFATVNLPDQTATITTHSGVWVGSNQLTQPVGMSLAQAQTLLQKAGYTGDFTYVTYRQPIAGGFTPHPLFIFGKLGPTGYVGVDTVTGVVTPIK